MDASLPLTNDSIEYKFTLDGWTNQENFAPGTPGTKTSGIYTNRFAVLNGDTILDGKEYNSAYAVPGQVYVTMQVNMSNQAVDTSGVFLAGGVISEIQGIMKCIQSVIVFTVLQELRILDSSILHIHQRRLSVLGM